MLADKQTIYNRYDLAWLRRGNCLYISVASIEGRTNNARI